MEQRDYQREIMENTERDKEIMESIREAIKSLGRLKVRAMSEPLERMYTGRRKKWIGTYNNPPMDFNTFVEELHKLPLQYCAACHEKASQNHYHVYLVAKSTIEAQRILSLFPGMHLEPKGHSTSKQVRDYIFKVGKHSGKCQTLNTAEWGELPNESQGERTDLKAALQMLNDGYSLKDVILNMPGTIRYMNQLRQAKTMLQKPVHGKKEVMVLIGPTRCGKTSWVYAHNPEEDLYCVDDWDHPFDEYESESTLLLDDFRGEFSISYLLRLLDRYPVKLLARYANKQAAYTKVFITSNTPIDLWYPKIDPETRKALYARFDRVYEWKDGVMTDTTEKYR